MKWLYKQFDKYLPRNNYNNEPILYLTNDMAIIYVYSFDRKKEVVLTSKEWNGEYRYMSLFEIFYAGWHIIHKKDINKILNIDIDSDEFPF